MIRCILGVFLATACLGVPAADPAKTLRVAFAEAESTFDPALFQDVYSVMVAENIFDSMLTYDYLERPAKLIPQTLEAMPEISPDGRTYIFRVRQGIYFTPDAAFKGKPRELVAADYAYSILRFFDPRVKSPNLYLVEDRIMGLDEAMERARKSGRFDYDARYEGLQVLDRYTLRLKLKRTDYTFIYNMAIAQFGAVAREVVEQYGDDFGNHPVGTGPYMLAHWTRAHRMVLEANPGFRELRDADGRKLPLIGRVEIFVIQENQPRWLAFPERTPPRTARQEGHRGRGRNSSSNTLSLRRPAHRLYLFQFRRPGDRRLRAAAGRAAARDRARVRHAAGDSRAAQEPGGPGAGPDPAGRRGLRPGVSQRHGGIRSGARQGAARHVRLHGPRRRRLPRASRRLAARARAREPAGPRVAPVRRALEEMHGRDRRAHHLQARVVAGPAQGIPRRQAPDVDAQLVGIEPRRQVLHGPLLRPTACTTRRASCPIHPSERASTTT